VKPYHKIQTVFKRDPATKHKTLLLGEYSKPEFQYLENTEWEFTEKVDGTNIRVHLDGEGGFQIAGRTDKSQIPLFLYKALIDMFGCRPRLRQHNSRYPARSFAYDYPVTLYGEGYGEKIQKGGGNYRSDQSFVLFDVNINGTWLERKNVLDIAEWLDITAVPIIRFGTLADAIELVRDGFTSAWGNFTAEGIVARPKTELLSRNGERIITKIKHKDFRAKQ
jgi:hypothetical protein